MTKPIGITDKDVGSRVRMRRLMLDMSQTALAKAIGLTFQQVQKYEKGINRISASRLVHIARVLKVPITFFFDDLAKSSQQTADGVLPAHISEFITTSEGLALMRAFTAIKATSQRRAIVDLVETIAAQNY